MTSDTSSRSDPARRHPSFSWRHTWLAMEVASCRSGAFRAAMDHPSYPLSSAYDPRWILGNAMGPPPVWLAEDLAPAMQFKPGQRVLDLGCGAAITSIFLAREFGLEVWATDLWIDPNDNAARIAETDVERQVVPMRAEARNLPFAHGFFDAIVSIDAYHYFGTDIRYLSYLAQFLKPDGRIGIVVPGNATDPDDAGAVPLPHEMATTVGADWYTFRSAQWWHRHLSSTPCIDVELAAMIDGGHAHWLSFCDAIEAGDCPAAEFLNDRAILECEAGQSLGFCKVVARRNDMPTINFGPGEYATRIS